jgi:uncharacterized SAM-dependent methyltransferase
MKGEHAAVRKIWQAAACVLLGVLLGAAFAGCKRAETKQPERVRTEFERDMLTVKNGGFAHMYVFARKDGQPMQSDDKAFLKAHPPDDVNSMWLLTDGERRVILGTNADLTPDNKIALATRFKAEDYTGWYPPR